MIIVKILGGLGNQMFQYAFYRELLFRSKDAKLDNSQFDGYDLHFGYELQKVFKNTSIRIASMSDVKKYSDYSNYPLIFKFRRLINALVHNSKHVTESSYTFNYKYFQMEECYLDGYWQSEKYFGSVHEEIRNTFIFPELTDKRNIVTLNEILSCNSVSIHVRRGDYVNHPRYKNICTEKYYLNAIQEIRNIISNPVFFVFSNDIEWCKVHLNLMNVHFVYWNQDDTSYIDMYLMSMCKHNIIANSTFSWWGAWLNSNKQKVVIAPTRIINDKRNDMVDLIPKEWKRVGS